MRVLAFLAVLLPALAVAQGVQYEPRIGGGTGNVFSPYPGRVSPVVSLIAWDKGGSSDWGAGIPAPTIDCAAVGTSSVAALQCSGATPSFAGPGQVAAGSPWWYRNDTAVRPSIALNGSTDWWDLGDVGDPADDLAACVGWRNNATGVQSLWGKYSAAGKGWIIYTNATSVVVEVCKAGPTCSSITLTGANVAGAFAKACFGYDYVADGTSVLRLTVNGVAATAVTNAVGPIVNVATTLRLGSDGYDERVNGAIRRGAIWTGADAPTSAAQLAQLVATQWGLAADKPAGAVATHARTDSTLCCPFSDAECYWVGPGAPCIHAPTYQGWASGGAVAGGAEVYGVATNLLVQSTDFAATWSALASPGSISAANSTDFAAPDGSMTADKITITGGVASAGQYAVLRHNPVSGSGSGSAAVGVWVRAGAGVSAVRLYAYDGAYRIAVECPLSAAWTHCGAAAATTGAWYVDIGAIYNAGSHTISAGTFYLWGAHAHQSAVMQPYRPTTGTAYAGLASTATTLTVPVYVAKEAFCVMQRQTLPVWNGIYPFTLGGYGSVDSYTGIFDGSNKLKAYQWYTGGYRTWIANDASSFASNSAHTLMWCNSAGVGSLFVDGSSIGITASDSAGTYAPIGTMPSTLTVGPTVGASTINGLVSRTVQCKRSQGCK